MAKFVILENVLILAQLWSVYQASIVRVEFVCPALIHAMILSVLMANVSTVNARQIPAKEKIAFQMNIVEMESAFQDLLTHVWISFVIMVSVLMAFVLQILVYSLNVNKMSTVTKENVFPA